MIRRQVLQSESYKVQNVVKINATMCGLFAVISTVSTQLPSDVENRVDRALNAIQHRGPDARGTFVDPKKRFAFGHVRLSVIDIAATSNQPFWSSCGRYCILFNGEIYNYIELRERLIREGVAFRTQSDTEVLLQALITWGSKCLNMLNGMWGLVFVDTQTGRFIISRDRFGVKPLYTFVHNGSLVICSEAKGILAYLDSSPTPNCESIGLFLKFGVGAERCESWFQGINRFPVASYVEAIADRQGDLFQAPTAYWEYPTSRTIDSMEDVAEQLRETLVDAIRIRLRSDVPVGLSLSAGLDSSAIAGLTADRLDRHLLSFTSWFEPVEKSELQGAQKIASKFGHTLTPIQQADQASTLQDLRTCIYHLDSGHASTAIVPYLNLCRKARQSVTVMLEGQGADELLGGYPGLALLAGADWLMRGKFRSFFECCRQYGRQKDWKRLPLEYLRYASRAIYSRQATRWNSGNFLGAIAAKADPENLIDVGLRTNNLANGLKLSHHEGLVSLLHYGDAISMSVNLETRCPFMDYRIVELGFQIRTSLLINHGFGKLPLRRSMDTILPKEICWNLRKDGFTNPTATVIREYVRMHGLPYDALKLAVKLGIFKNAEELQQSALKLPENILYRVFSVLIWVEVFYLQTAGLKD